MSKRMLSTGKRMRPRKVAKDSVPIETYPGYLRRVGSDYAASGYAETAQDYREAADLIDDLTAFIDSVLDQEDLVFPSDIKRMKILLKRVTR